MERKVLVSIVVTILVFSIGVVVAHGNFNETKELIDSGISCSDLSEEQLEEIGDYYMEQMHPGKQHEMMHQMMGGESSETTRLMHINMAKSIYCGESNQSMMPMMSMMSSGMMYGNIMSRQTSQTNIMQGMTGNLEYGSGYWNFVNLLYVILIISLTILFMLGIIKLWKEGSYEL